MASQNSLVVKLSLPSRQAFADPSQAAQPLIPAAAPTPTKMSSYFTQSQLALALTIQKVKPRELSVPGMSSLSILELRVKSIIEFCQQLRNHIKTGQPTTKDHLRYVDTSEFWKDQYTSIHNKNKALEDKLRCLEEGQSLSHDQSSADEDLRQIFEAENFRMMELGTLRKRPASTQDVESSQDPSDVITSPSVWDNNILRLSSCGAKEPSGCDSCVLTLK